MKKRMFCPVRTEFLLLDLQLFDGIISFSREVCGNNCVLNCRVSVIDKNADMDKIRFQCFKVNAKYFISLREYALLQHARMTLLNCVRAEV
jgi:hypothetical protein